MKDSERQPEGRSLDRALNTGLGGPSGGYGQGGWCHGAYAPEGWQHHVRWAGDVGVLLFPHSAC